MVTSMLYDMAKSKSWSSKDRSMMNPPSGAALDPQASPIASHRARETTSPPSYWRYANEKVKDAAEEAYASVADFITGALYTDGSTSMFNHSYYKNYRNWLTASGQEGYPASTPLQIETPRRSSLKRSTSISARELAMMFKNPYEHVRGRNSHQSAFSVSAIRSLLTLVPQTMPAEPSIHNLLTDASSHLVHDYYNSMDDSCSATPHDRHQRPLDSPFVSPAETASQIAEGTIRALRDLALDEAVELHNALRFWSERWERPMLSWLEAGPEVWTRPGGYNHQAIGRKVAQIQSILARRCASIGELQTHLLRAGWHKGVAQWGVLGDGGQWAAVAGFDAFTGDPDDESGTMARTRTLSSIEITTDPEVNKVEDDYYLGDESMRNQVPPIQSILSGQSEANIFVEKHPGGGLIVDDPVFLAEWSVEGIKLVRKQLERAADGLVLLPYRENWSHEHQNQVGETDRENSGRVLLPVWARETSELVGKHEGAVDPQKEITLMDLPAMIEEVSELVDIMEPIMTLQRRRRLERLRPPPWLRRNWLLVTAAGPLASYICYKIVKGDYAKEALKQVIEKVKDFCRERIQEPISAIIQELWKGRAPFSDREARLEAIESLKKMIRNWLDENYPDIPVERREALASKMDVTLIEKQKVESMKTFYEINKVIQMSFIEMQYMKKEMLNALEAIDQMLSANDINMNVAAITPVAMLVYVSSRLFKFIYYALLKLGKSREETYASLRSILTDIERLLVMRDNPPKAPPLPGQQRRETEVSPIASTVLSPDDLGMLMLLLHGCRQIIWSNHRRFPLEAIRSMSEDLAELAGERGPVSVQQQLQILSRMSRTYPFLKVVSTGNVRTSRIIR